MSELYRRRISTVVRAHYVGVMATYQDSSLEEPQMWRWRPTTNEWASTGYEAFLGSVQIF